MSIRACWAGVLLLILPVSSVSAAERVITLAPHLAELVVAAGAGDQLVGVSRFSDFPPQVAVLPAVGDAFNFNNDVK